MGISGRLKGYFKGVSKSFIGNPRKFLWCFKGVLMEFQWTIMWVQGCLKEVQRCSRSFMNVSLKFSGCFKEVLRFFQGRLRGVSRVSKRSSKSVQREFGGIFKDVLRKFQRKF